MINFDGGSLKCQRKILLSGPFGTDRGYRSRNMICVLYSGELRKDILEEAHKSRLTVHPRGTKMYKDLKRNF